MSQRSSEHLREPLRRVLVATDFSEGSALAIRRALRLPLAADASVQVLHVSPSDVSVQGAGERAEPGVQARLADAVRLAREEARAVGRAGLQIDGELAAGPVAPEIIRRARFARCDLTVLGRHGRRRIRDLVMGTTAERVVQKGDLPALVVHADVSGPYARPLIATDLEDASGRVFELALRVVTPDVQTIRVLHAFRTPFDTWLARGSSELATEYREEVQNTAAQNLAKVIEPWQHAGVHFEPSLMQGDARGAIADEIEYIGADLVILGSHARSGLARTLGNSVLEAIVGAVDRDVLIAAPVHTAYDAP